MSLAQKPHSKAPSPPGLLCRNTEKSTVGIGLQTGKYHFLMVSFPVVWIPLVMILGAVQVVSAAEGPHTSKGTFLSLAAPVPERMASIKACLASTVLLRVPVLNLETVTEAEGGWEGAEGGGGRTGGGGGPWSSC